MDVFSLKVNVGLLKNVGLITEGENLSLSFNMFQCQSADVYMWSMDVYLGPQTISVFLSANQFSTATWHWCSVFECLAKTNKKNQGQLSAWTPCQK